MGISFEIDAEEGVIYSIAEGKIGLEDLKTYITDLWADPNFSPDLGHILELRLAHQNVTKEEVKALTAALPVDHTRKLAIVADGTKRELALRYKEWVKEKIPVEVFTDFGSAKKWTTSD